MRDHTNKDRRELFGTQELLIAQVKERRMSKGRYRDKLLSNMFRYGKDKLNKKSRR
jgi:hypothetical protein